MNGHELVRALGWSVIDRHGSSPYGPLCWSRHFILIQIPSQLLLFYGLRFSVRLKINLTVAAEFCYCNDIVCIDSRIRCCYYYYCNRLHEVGEEVVDRKCLLSHQSSKMCIHQPAQNKVLYRYLNNSYWYITPSLLSLTRLLKSPAGGSSFFFASSQKVCVASSPFLVVTIGSPKCSTSVRSFFSPTCHLLGPVRAATGSIRWKCSIISSGSIFPALASLRPRSCASSKLSRSSVHQRRPFATVLIGLWRVHSGRNSNVTGQTVRSCSLSFPPFLVLLNTAISSWLLRGTTVRLR